jgi:hypothetical protein
MLRNDYKEILKKENICMLCFALNRISIKSISFKGFFYSIFTLLLFSFASAKCPCGADTLDHYIVLSVNELPSQEFNVVLNNIDSQFICRKKLGIVRNYCSDPYLLVTNNRDVDSLSINEYLLLLSYRKRCYQFQKELDFPINLENDTILLNLSIKENLSKRDSSYLNFLYQQSMDMRSTIGDDEYEDYKNNQWKVPVDITHIPDHYDQSIGGKYFLLPGFACLQAGVLGTLYASKHCRSSRPPENFYHEFDQVRNLLVWTICIVADIVSPVLLITAAEMELRYRSHKKERECCTF